MVAAAGVAMLGGIGVATTAQADPPVYKDYVCKYDGTPGVDETLKTGNFGFVWVDSSATQGTYFNDAQDDSYVLLTHVLKDPEPVSAGVVQGATCPAGRVPIVTVTSEHATSCTEYSVRDVTTTIGWVEVDGQWVKDDPVITNGPWVNSVPTAEQLKAAGLVCTIAPPAVAPTVLGVVKNAPVVAPVVAGVVKSAAVKTLAFTGAETVPLGLSGLLALVLGAVLTVASRRQGGKEARE